MDQTRGHRKFLYDLAYKWTPLGFVVFLFIVCTALLSVSGKLSHAEVVGFCVTAGLLITFFATCHLILYCTRIKYLVDLEKYRGENSTTSSSSHPGEGVPASAEIHRQSQEREQQSAQQSHDKDKNQTSQSGTNNSTAGTTSNHRPRTQLDGNTHAHAEDAPDEEPWRPPLRVVNEVRRDVLSSAQVPPHRQRARSHNSAAPEPLSTRGQQAGHPETGSGGQREYKPYRRPDPKTPSHPRQRRDSHATVEIASSFHTSALTPEEAMDSVQRTMGREPWFNPGAQSLFQRRRHDHRPSASHAQRTPYALMSSPPPGQRAKRRLFPGEAASPNSSLVEPPSRWNEGANQAGPPNRPAELAAGGVRGYLVLLQEPDLMNVLSRRLPELKDRSRPLDQVWDEFSKEPVSCRSNTDAVVLDDNPERKSIQVHDSSATVERSQSQRAQILQHSPDRPSGRSSDSGYVSGDGHKLRRSMSTPQLYVGVRGSFVSSLSENP